MARFTDREKWKDTWFRKLNPNEKLLWLYIIDTCDNAGFFELDAEMCAFFIKMSEEEVLGAIKGLNRGLIHCKNTNHYYVKNFLKHQLNLPLVPANNAHKQIIRIIVSREDDFPSVYEEHLGAIKGLISSPSKGKGKSNNKSNVEKEEVTSEYTDDFNQFWEAYPRKCGKRSAFKSFVKAKKRGTLDQMLNAIRIQSGSDQWTREGGTFIPHPQTWLNQNRWEDESIEKKEEVRVIL